MPPFQPKACVPVPAPTLPSCHRAGAWRPRGLHHVRRPDVQAADVVQSRRRWSRRPARSPTARRRCRTARASTARPLRPPRRRERVGQDDRRFDRAQLVDLRRSGELAERVADEHRARHLLLEHVAAVRHDRPSRRCGRVSPSIERGVTDATPATSVIALSGPGSNTPGASPISRARGRSTDCAKTLRRDQHDERADQPMRRHD